MRHVTIRAVPSGWQDEPVAPQLAAEVRSLPDRFPGAGLRRVELRRADDLDRRADATGGTRVWLACECLQVTGSFKVRGALCALSHARSCGCDHVVVASAGNHGAGVSHAARVLGMRATVVAPASAPRVKLARMQGAGVEVVRTQGGYDQAEQTARELAAKTGSPFISPCDDDRVLMGNGASLALEMASALGRVPDRVLAPVGGGGLAVGLAEGLSVLSAGADRAVWVVQSEASPAFALSVVGGHVHEELAPFGKTLAEGLEGGISRRSAARVAARVDGVSVVSEASIAAAMAGLGKAYGLRVEGSGAAAAVLAWEGLPPGWAGGDLVVVLTGGNVDEEVVGAVVTGGGGC